MRGAAISAAAFQRVASELEDYVPGPNIKPLSFRAHFEQAFVAFEKAGDEKSLPFTEMLNKQILTFESSMRGNDQVHRLLQTAPPTVHKVEPATLASLERGDVIKLLKGFQQGGFNVPEGTVCNVIGQHDYTDEQEVGNEATDRPLTQEGRAKIVRLQKVKEDAVQNGGALYAVMVVAQGVDGHRILQLRHFHEFILIGLKSIDFTWEAKLAKGAALALKWNNVEAAVDLLERAKQLPFNPTECDGDVAPGSGALGWHARRNAWFDGLIQHYKESWSK